MFFLLKNAVFFQTLLSITNCFHLNFFVKPFIAFSTFIVTFSLKLFFIEKITSSYFKVINIIAKIICLRYV